MSRSRTAWMTCSSAAAGSAPGREKTRTPSRKAISVGIEVIRAAPASAAWSSVSTLPNVMSGCLSAAAAKTGANIRHGPHQDAHQSTSVIPSRMTVSSNVSSVSATVLILHPSGFAVNNTPWGIAQQRSDGIPGASASATQGRQAFLGRDDRLYTRPGIRRILGG